MLVFRLKEIAEAKGLNPHRISMQTGISYPTVRKYWKGQLDDRDFSILNKLCELLDVQPGDLVQRVAIPTSDHIAVTDSPAVAVQSPETR